MSAFVACAQIVVFYSFLFTVPAFLTFLYTGGRTQLSREDLMKSEAYQAKMREKYGEESEIRQKEMKEAMNKVLFETKGTLGKPDWAIKRDQERERRRQQEELRRQQEKQD